MTSYVGECGKCSKIVQLPAKSPSVICSDCANREPLSSQSVLLESHENVLVNASVHRGDLGIGIQQIKISSKNPVLPEWFLQLVTAGDPDPNPAK